MKVDETRGQIAEDKDPSVIRKQKKAELQLAADNTFGKIAEQLVDEYANRQITTGSALQLMALLYPRPGKLRQAAWSEFDLDNGTWEIPVTRMKLRHPHVKPLPFARLPGVGFYPVERVKPVFNRRHFLPRAASYVGDLRAGSLPGEHRVIR